MAWVEAYTLKERSLWAVNSRVGRSWCLWAILCKWDSLKEHVRMEVGMIGDVEWFDPML